MAKAHGVLAKSPRLDMQPDDRMIKDDTRARVIALPFE